MEYADATLLQMADPITRTALFDEASLEQLVSAAYDVTAALTVEGPYHPTFEEFQLGFPLPEVTTAEGFWRPDGGIERVEARFQLSGRGQGNGIRIDAYWRGTIVARVASSTERVTEVETAWPSMSGLDAEIIANLGALPADAQTLEQERRARFLERVRAALQQPDVFTEAALDRWLSSVGATSVGDLMARYAGTVQPGTLRITYSEPTPGPTSPKALSIAAAVLIRDAGFSVGQLLLDSKTVLQRLEALGFQSPAGPPPRPRHPLLALWVVPASIFDDEGWPGGQPDTSAAAKREARRTAAGLWLAREGIGLLATP